MKKRSNKKNPFSPETERVMALANTLVFQSAPEWRKIPCILSDLRYSYVTSVLANMNKMQLIKAVTHHISKCGMPAGWVVGARRGERCHRYDGGELPFQTSAWVRLTADSESEAFAAVNECEKALGTSSMLLGESFSQVFAFHKD